ncbi:MAG TPA: protocatechuate 3,4-dioxygenase subunit alpha [Polyangiaceae bacterium]|nr:protocatechuate 3,4-dioxygenase subunit alpha [Polyangiaceae bacterium]
MTLKHTPSQTVGPYFSMCLAGSGRNCLVPAAHLERIRIVGSVYDSDRAPIDDVLVELWQANASGRYRHPMDTRATLPLTQGFSGFGRATVDPVSHEYAFDTVKPGPVPAPDGSLQAPHIGIIVQGRGMLRPLFTRLYFPEETSANDADFVLAHVPGARRGTLVAARVQGAGVPTYRFDVRLQGADETVFFEL